MTSQSRFRQYSWKHQLVLLTMALLFSSCSTAAGMIPNTALPMPTSIALEPQVQASQPPAPTVLAEPTLVATQLQAVATNLPASIPIQATALPPSQIPTIVPTQAATQLPTILPTLIPTTLPTIAIPTQQPTALAAPTRVPASENGLLLFLRKGNLWLAQANGGNERQLAEGVTDFAASSNGTQIALLRGQGRNTEIWLMSRDGSALRQLTRNNREEARLSWAADGTALVTGSAASDTPYAHEWIAWSHWCKRAEVRLVDIKTGAETSLAAGCDPAFAPDSKRIAYTAPPATVADGFPQDGPMVANAIRLINRQGKNGWNFAIADGTGPESGGLLVYAPVWTPDSANVVYHRFMGAQIDIDINLTEIGRSFEGKGKVMADGAGWLLPVRFSDKGDRVALVQHDYGNARGLVGAGAWSLELLQLQGSRDISMPHGTLNAIGKRLDRLNGAQAVAWAPGGQSLAVLLPKGWAANADPEAWGEQPGEIRSWLPGQAPAIVLVSQVDYASPIVWLAP